MKIKLYSKRLENELFTLYKIYNAPILNEILAEF